MRNLQHEYLIRLYHSLFHLPYELVHNNAGGHSAVETPNGAVLLDSNKVATERLHTWCEAKPLFPEDE